MGKLVRKTGIAILWLVIWQLLAVIVHNKILLAGPVETAGALARMTSEPEFWDSISQSYAHIMLGIFIGIVLGVVLSLLAHRYAIISELLSPLVTALKAIPVASFIILILIWIGSENVATVVVGLVVFPITYVGMENGFTAADDKLLEMAHVYRMPGFNQFRFIYLPSLIPSITAAISLAVPMGFKSGVAAEVIGQPLLSMGNGLYKAKIYLDTGDVFAWTFVIVLISWVTEKLILLILSLFKKGGRTK